MTASQFVFLVGGFGASPWLFQEVGREIATQGLTLTRPDDLTYVCFFLSIRSIHVWNRSKAVAVGAVYHYLDHPVVSRIVRYTYGTESSVEYDPTDREHRQRAHKKYLGIMGDVVLDIFSPALTKVAVIIFWLPG